MPRKGISTPVGALFRLPGRRARRGIPVGSGRPGIPGAKRGTEGTERRPAVPYPTLAERPDRTSARFLGHARQDGPLPKAHAGALTSGGHHRSETI